MLSRRESGAARVDVEHNTRRVFVVLIEVPARGWVMRLRGEEGGVRIDGRGLADGTARLVEGWRAALSLVPETVGDAAVRPEVAALVDLDGRFVPGKRDALKAETTRAVESLAERFGEREAAAALSEEAGKLALRVTPDPDLEEALGGTAAAELRETADPPV